MTVTSIPPQCLEFVRAIDSDNVCGTHVGQLKKHLQDREILTYCLNSDLMYYTGFDPDHALPADVQKTPRVRTTPKGRALVAEFRLNNRIAKSQTPDFTNETERSIVQALRENGHRMTGDVLLKKAVGSVNGFGKSTLAKLRTVGVLDNTRDSRGQGYGLPEWVAR